MTLNAGEQYRGKVFKKRLNTRAEIRVNWHVLTADAIIVVLGMFIKYVIVHNIILFSGGMFSIWIDLGAMLTADFVMGGEAAGDGSHDTNVTPEMVSF